MPEVTRARTVAAPRERVWDLVSDPFHLPRWWPSTARVELTTAERLRGRYRLGGWVVRRAARRRLDEALAGIAEATE